MSDLKLTVEREVKPQEVTGLIYGTGALTWPWWRSVKQLRNGKEVVGHDLDDAEAGDTFRFRFDTEEDDEGAFSGDKTLTMQEIVDAAARALRGDGASIDDESSGDMAREDLGYADAMAADAVLQLAVFGKVVFG